MTLSDYSIFVAVVESRSLTLAAKKLHLTKSAISHAITRMESDLGIPLFLRSQRELKLTPEGERLLPFVHAVLREDKRFMDEIRSLHGLTSGSVTLGTCSSTCINWVSDILNGFRKKYPNINVFVRGGNNNAEILRCLKLNEIDIGIAAAEPSETIETIDMYRDEMLCVTSTSFASRDPGVIHADELKGIPLILQSGDFGAEALDVLAALSIEAEPNMTAVDDASLVAMVSGGLGYCIVGKLVLKAIHSDVKTFSFDPPQYRMLSLLRNRRVTRSPATKALSDYICSYVAGYPPFDLTN